MVEVHIGGDSLSSWVIAVSTAVLAVGALFQLQRLRKEVGLYRTAAELARELERDRIRSMRPTISVENSRIDDDWQPHVMLRNSGRGVALYVRLDAGWMPSDFEDPRRLAEHAAAVREATHPDVAGYFDFAAYVTVIPPGAESEVELLTLEYFGGSLEEGLVGAFLVDINYQDSFSNEYSEQTWVLCDRSAVAD